MTVCDGDYVFGILIFGVYRVTEKVFYCQPSRTSPSEPHVMSIWLTCSSLREREELRVDQVTQLWQAAQVLCVLSVEERSVVSQHRSRAAPGSEEDLTPLFGGLHRLVLLRRTWPHCLEAFTGWSWCSWGGPCYVEWINVPFSTGCMKFPWLYCRIFYNL